MADPQGGSKDFLTLVRGQVGNPELTFEQAMELPLAKTLFALLAGNSLVSSQETPSPQVRRPLSAFAESQAVIEAAIQDTFSLDELITTEDERGALIAAADVVMLDGKRRLCLTDQARAELLQVAGGSALYNKTLREAVAKDRADFKQIGSDPVRLPSAWLHGFLLNEFGDLINSPRSELTAALTARRRLRLVTNLPPKVPEIADLERRVAFAQLLEPLRLLIGAEGGWDGVTPPSDRFVGRDSELASLRGFVGEQSSQSLLESVSRLGNSVFSSVGLTEKASLRVVQADGGLGKSALLAKFLLDHVVIQKNPFPFAYLDFDRASLDPNHPHQLLIEMAQQVGLQFPGSQSEFSEMIESIRQGRFQTSPASSVSIRDPFANFVEILRKHATLGSRAFLLVLDTLEVVQWNPIAIDRLAGLISQFVAKGLVELRVVASGRADLPELRLAAGVSTAASNILLQPLSVDEAIEMADRLGKAAIGAAWSPAWSRAIVENTSETSLLKAVKRILKIRDDVRREPLTVRVAVDLILQTESGRREAILSEIRDLSGNSQVSIAGRLYQRRILNHVRNENAKKLAWPGLVLRRVTLEIAKNLLAPLCKLAPENVVDAYQALGREVWMVIPDGNGLKHRPDLRARTLPLMRDTDPEIFENTARAAVDYFGRLRGSNEEFRAEWIYHRLLLGAGISEVAADITADILPRLAGAAEDFPLGSEAASFLLSRTVKARMSPTQIRNLTAKDALFHLSATSQTVFGLDDANVDPITLLVSDRLAYDRSQSYRLEPWAQALWIKTGAWRYVEPALPGPGELPKPVWRSLLYWAVRSLVVSPTATARSEFLRWCIAHLTAQVESGEELGFRTAVQAMALARACNLPIFSALDGRIVGLLSQMKPNPQASTQAALRTAIIFGNTCRRPSIEAWLNGRRRGTIDRVQEPTFSFSELRMLGRLDAEALSLVTRTGVDRYRLADDGIVSSASRILEQFLASPLDDAHLGGKIAQVFACRDEDWVVPFGYSAERVTEGHYSRELRDRIEGYAVPKDAKSQARVMGWSDMLGAARIADEASDLVGFATLIAEQPAKNEEAQEELKNLISCRAQWSILIENLTGGYDHQGNSHPSQANSDAPAPPPLGQDKSDPQKGRWGGKSAVRGRTLQAVLESAERNIFYFSLVVESVDGSPLEPPVIFHLHDSFPRSILRIRHISEGKRATLSDWNAYGVFTVGVQVKDATGTWISLELDLASLPGLPTRFLSK